MKKIFGDFKISLPVFILLLGLGFFIGILTPSSAEAYPYCQGIFECLGTPFTNCTQYNYDECCNCCEYGYGDCTSPYPICEHHVRYEHINACLQTCGYHEGTSWISYCGTECEVNIGGTICTYPAGSICENASCGSCNYHTCDFCDLCSNHKLPQPEGGCAAGSGCFMESGSSCQCVKGACGAECNEDGSGCPTGKECDTTNCLCITPLKSDLYINDIEEFGSDKKVHYTIKNQGDIEAGSSKSSLDVDGSYETYDSVSSILAGSSRDEYFSSWTCTPGETYDIEVCADKDDDVDEEDEGNNCRTETLTCPGAECTGTLNVSITGSGTCTVTASLTATNCDGKPWEIERNSSPKWSGEVSGSPYSETKYDTVGVGNYTYKLYINGWESPSRSVTCSAAAGFDFSISVSPPSDTVTKGDAINTTVNLSLTSGTTQSVTLSASNLPPGASYAFYSDGTQSNSCSPSCSRRMTIFTTADTPLGNYPNIKITGTGGGKTHDAYYNLTVTQPGAEITPPDVETVGYTNLTQTSVTLNGYLHDLGGASSCLVWFEWGLTTSLGNKTPYQTKISTGSFPANISGLTSNKTYYFEAFAKNGGSW